MKTLALESFANIITTVMAGGNIDRGDLLDILIEDGFLKPFGPADKYHALGIPTELGDEVLQYATKNLYVLQTKEL